MNRLKERAVILPIIAFILLTPPILLLFNSSNLIFGIPILYIYAFSIWIILTIIGFFLTKALQKAEQKLQKEQAKEKAFDKNNLKWQLR